MIFGLYLFFSTNLILRLNDFVPGIKAFPLAQIMIPILFVLWLLFEKKDFTTLPDFLVPAFLGLILANQVLLISATSALTQAQLMIPFILLYFLSANLVRTPRRRDALTGCFLMAAMVLVAHSVQQSANYDGVDDKSGVGWTGIDVLNGRVRYVGVLNDPNDLALFFCMMLPGALQLTNSLQIGIRAAGYLLCLPLLYGIFLTNSRGAIIAVGAVAFLFSCRKWGWFKSGIVCAVLALAVLSFGPSRVREKSQSDDESSQSRVDAWYTGFQFFRQKPLTGIGKDQFQENHVITAHNSFVLCFAENGLPGYVIWFGTVACCLYGLHHVIQRTRPGTRQRRQAIGIFDSLIVFCVGGFFLSRTYWLVLAVYLGLAMSMFKTARDDLEELHESPPNESADWGDYTFAAPALPDLSPRAITALFPRLIALTTGSMMLIYIVVKISLRFTRP